MTEVDFGRTVHDYASHRAEFPMSLFVRLQNLGLITKGNRILDVGAGTGNLARRFASLGCIVTGLDRSQEMIAKAKEITSRNGESVSYVQASVEQIPFADQQFEIVTAGQSWHWFDRQRATKEVSRVLVAGGLLLIAHFDWIPLNGNVVDATEMLIKSFNPQWKLGGGMGIYPEWFHDLALGGFLDIESFSFDVVVPYTKEGWVGRVRASAGVGASLSQLEIERFELKLWACLRSDFEDNPLLIPHRVWCVYGRKPR